VDQRVQHPLQFVTFVRQENARVCSSHGRPFRRLVGSLSGRYDEPEGQPWSETPLMALA
jgi:hypothetical protein